MLMDAVLNSKAPCPRARNATHVAALLAFMTYCFATDDDAGPEAGDDLGHARRPHDGFRGHEGDLATHVPARLKPRGT